MDCCQVSYRFTCSRGKLIEMKLLNGSEIAAFIKERQAKQVRNLRQSWKVVPKLVVVQTIDDPVIDTYVRLKRRYAEDILVEFELRKVEQAQVIDVVHELNTDDTVHGIVVQLPLAEPGQTDAVVQAVDADKDVDGLGKAPRFDPATPLAIHWLLAAYNVELAGQNIAIVGNGRLVGAPLARMWRASGYDVTVYDETTNDLSARRIEHDIIVSATGVPRLITSGMVKLGATVVDAGTAAEHGVIVGDVDDAVRARDDVTITPVVGGVGPLTIAALLDNVITAARRTTAG